MLNLGIEDSKDEYGQNVGIIVKGNTLIKVHYLNENEWEVISSNLSINYCDVLISKDGTSFKKCTSFASYRYIGSFQKRKDHFYCLKHFNKRLLKNYENVKKLGEE